MTIKLTLLLLCVWGNSVSAASVGSPPETTEFSGKVWARYSYDFTAGDHALNGFDIYRAFFQAQHTFAEHWSALLLLDHDRSAVNGWAYVRNAYVQGDQLLGEGSQFRFGLQRTFFIATLEDALGTRWLGRTLLDETKVDNSQDGGISLRGDLAADLHYGLMIHNGSEGLSGPVSDNILAFTAQAEWTPFRGENSELRFVLSNTASGAGTSVAVTPGFPTGAPHAVPAQATLAAALIAKRGSSRAALELATTRMSGNTNLVLGPTLLVGWSEKNAIYLRLFGGDGSYQNASGSRFICTVGPVYSIIKDKILTAVIFEWRAMSVPTVNDTKLLMWNMAANF